MPPKRKAANGAAKTLAKKKKTEDTTNEDSKSEFDKTIENLKSVDNTKKIHTVDSHFPQKNAQIIVYQDYDCMLNQTNIGQNNNKFYVIQLLQNGQTYTVWTRWGRVGEIGQSAQLGPYNDIKEAIRNFEKKFKDKTSNDWNKRTNFVARPGKYEIIELADDSDDQNPSVVQLKIEHTPTKTLPCTLKKETENIIRRITNEDTFVFAMQSLNLDVKKMPLGKLSSNQLVKAFDVLDEIDQALKSKKNNSNKDLESLSSRFYTIVPHNFGRVRPPVIDSETLVREKLDLLLVLSDIALAQKLQGELDNGNKKTKELPPHPLDDKYKQLQCELDLLDPKGSEFKLLSDYFNNTQGYQQKLLNIWRVNRSGEADRIKKHNKIENRKLLFHGTNIACIVAILKTGLRIMPHAGGLVGRGLYFASQSQKSINYTRSDREGHRIMFLVEVVLGKEHYIYSPVWSLVKPPDGFNSVVAVGIQDFDEKQAKSTKLDGRTITVPYVKGIQKSVKSSFGFNEFVIYDESQCQIRYMIEFQ